MPRDLTAVRVRALIDASGLSQARFAARAGLDASKMSKSLSGVRRFSSLDLARIAEVGGTSVDWLLGAGGGPPAVAARAANLHDGAVEAAVREAQRLADVREDLAFLGYERPPAIVPFEHAPHPTAGAELAAWAVAELRKAGGDPLTRDLASVVEHYFGVDVAVVAVPPGCDGLAFQTDHTRLVLVTTTDHPTRQRFTLAHELGHLLAGDDQGPHVDRDVMDPDRRRQPSERRANAFAAAFLLPEDTLRAALSEVDDLPVDAFARMVMRFSVSPSTLAYRLGGLGLVTHRQRDAFRTLTTAECAQRAGAAGEFAAWIEASRQPRLPDALLRDTFTAYADGKSTLRPFAQLVGTDVDSLREALETAPDPLPSDDAAPFAP
jgi:Zn-dependent peptidase ImmA (M78 family)/transcriptional regulator with XRE-family HTH domain